MANRNYGEMEPYRIYEIFVGEQDVNEFAEGLDLDDYIANLDSIFPGECDDLTDEDRDIVRRKLAQYIEEETSVTQAARALGRKGGQAKTDAKRKASAENGKQGGRPRTRTRYRIEYEQNGSWWVAHMDFDGIKGEYLSKRQAEADAEILRQDNPDYDFRVTER